MLFSFAVRSVYVESSSMFVRGGVYVVVRDAMGPFVARLSVSSLLFDHIRIPRIVFAACFGIVVTIYFWWENIKGMHESSGKALRIMQITTVMVVMFLLWCPLTMLVRGHVELPPAPLPRNLQFGHSALGWFKGTVWPPIPIVAMIIAFGH